MKNQYRIDGDKVFITLNKRGGESLETVIDIADFERVKRHKYKWYAYFAKGLGTYYAVSNNYNNTPMRTIRLHRYITDCPNNMVVDHINHDTLDNTRRNLRVVSHAENMHNYTKPKHNSSGYRGVSWNKEMNKWKASLNVDGETIYLGHYDTAEEADEVVKKARAKLMSGSLERIEIGELKQMLVTQRRAKCWSTNKSSGIRNVNWNEREGKWYVRISVNGKRKHIGCYENVDDAIRAKDEAERKYNVDVKVREF